MTAGGAKSVGAGGLMRSKNSKPEEIRKSNIQAGKALADAVRTSLGPRGMDKMIQDAKGEVTITNDGATILNQMNVVHPAARMLVELSKAQDIEAGDGTTSVVILAGSLLEAADKLLQKGIHPTSISDSFQKAAAKSVDILTSMAIPLDLNDRESLLKSANTSLNSKVVSQNSAELSPIAVDSVLRIIDPARDNNVNLKDIKIVKKLGGTVDDTALVEGLVLEQRASNVNGPKRVEKAKIGFIQFQVSPPKTDMDNQVVVSDYAAMDRVLKEERAYILNIVKQIKKAGCNVLLIQKSILRDALSDLAIHFFDKMKIMVVKDIEREDVEFLCKALSCRPIASLDHFTAENLTSAECVEEIQTGTSKCVKFTGIQNPGKTVSIILRGSNKLMLDEADRSLHDALCVIRCLVKKRFLIAGGGAPETEISRELMLHANTLTGADAYCFKAFAEAMEIIPYTLSENAGLNPIGTVTELRNRHAMGEKAAGINVRKGAITNILEENVVQPLLVSTSAITLASECVRSILKIDDINEMIEKAEPSLIGRRFCVEEKKGTILYQGPVGATNGEWLGVEWDDPSRGKHDGAHEGVRYFIPRNYSPTSSSFLRINKVNLGINLLEGVRLRYGKVEGETAGVGQECMDDLQKEIGARFVQVVGFDKVNKHQSQLDKLKSVSVGNMNINDTHVEIFSTLTSMVDLDLSDNLLSSWSNISDLVSQVPLRVLNLSFNHLPVPNSIPVDKYSHLVHLILGSMGYSWSDVERIAGDLPKLENLQVHRNKIKEISLTPGKFTKLKGLDLDSNLIDDWTEIQNLSTLQTLEYLQLNDNRMSNIKIESGMFKNLKGLQLGFNLISEWYHVSELNKLNITELRFRNNPVLQSEKLGEGRSTIVVLISSLKVLNGSEIQDTERKWAEIDYYKKHGLEYLRVLQVSEEERTSALETFTRTHGRYIELVNKFGEPTEGELKVKESNLKSSLVLVKISSPNLVDTPPLEKKLPVNMTVAKLKALVGRLFRKDAGGAELKLVLVSSRSPEQKEEMDNDLRELAYYSLENEDTLLVSW